MQRRFAIAIYAALAAWAFGQNSIIPVLNRASHIEELVQAYHDVQGFNGVVLAAAGEQVVFRKGYGVANADHAVPNTPETVFRLASVTKQFTATAMLLLAEREKVDLHAPLSEYLDNLKPEIADRVTLHHLLSHTAGLERDIERLSDKDSRDHFLMAEMIELVNTTSLRTEPGTEWRYSNIGFVLAAAVIESVTGKPYPQAMRELLFDPLGMSDTNHEPALGILSRRAEGMTILPDGLMKAGYEDKSYVTGAGSIYSTADDLLTWSRAVLDGRVLSESSVRTLTTAHTELAVQNLDGYAYGWFTFNHDCPDDRIDCRGITHDGGCPGFLTDLRWYPEHDIIVIVLGNARPFDCSGLSEAVGNILLGYPQEAPSVPVLSELARIALRDGVDAAVRRARELQSAGIELPRASEINVLGYDYLLKVYRAADAIRIQELQIALYPTSANAHDSLAETCEAAGRVEQAIGGYRRCLELDPGFEHARERLESLGASD